MAIIEHQRSADVWADTPVRCLELPLDSFADYRQLHPQIAMKIMRNLSALLARRLILANAKVDLLSATRAQDSPVMGRMRPRRWKRSDPKFNRAPRATPSGLPRDQAPFIMS